MRLPNEMSDAELGEAVARECLKWRHLTRAGADGCGDIMLPHNCGTVIIGEKCIWVNAARNVMRRECCDGMWAPCADATDAERVFDWLGDHTYRAMIHRMGQEHAAVFLLTERSFACVVDAPNWKRAVCLAALLVARERKPEPPPPVQPTPRGRFHPWHHDLGGVDPTIPVDVLTIRDGQRLDLLDLTARGPGFFYADRHAKVLLSLEEGQARLVPCGIGVDGPNNRRHPECVRPKTRPRNCHCSLAGTGLPVKHEIPGWSCGYCGGDFHGSCNSTCHDEVPVDAR